MLWSCCQIPISHINPVANYWSLLASPSHWDNAGLMGAWRTQEFSGWAECWEILRIHIFNLGTWKNGVLTLCLTSSLWVWSFPRLFKACPYALKSELLQPELWSPMVKSEVNPHNGLNLFLVNEDIVPWTDNFLTKWIEPYFCYI